MLKAVFLDIDNTLTSPLTRTIPKTALDAIAAARQRGIRVFAATGRNTLTREEGAVIRGVQLDGCVAMNGQICYTDESNVFFERRLDIGDCKAVLELSDRLGFACAVCEARKLYFNRISQRAADWHATIKIPLYPVLPVDLSGDIMMIAAYIGADMQSEVDAVLKHSTAVRYGGGACDIVPSDGGKEKGLEQMLAYFGIEQDECLAMGDADNDIGMLRWAGIGVAMSGSAPQVLEAADYISPTPDDNGVEHTFRKFGIID